MCFSNVSASDRECQSKEGKLMVEIKAYKNSSICKAWTDGIDIIEGWALKVQS